MTIKLFEMFAGYGGASFALKKTGIPFRCVGYSEIDKFAIQCYRQNHWIKSAQFPDGAVTPHNYGDATKINPKELPDFDLLTGGFPCQSFSVAGKGLGELDTRGTLFNEIIRIAEVKQPKYMLLENVKGLTFKKHKATFEKILSELDRIGYNVVWKVLNSKNYGVPQNRERVWFVCFRKDISVNFNWPKPQELTLFLKDILEKDVDGKYYLSEERVKALLSKERSFNERFCGGNTSRTLCARDYKDPKVIPILTPDRINKRQNGRRFKEDGEPMFTLNTQDKHGILQINNPKYSNDRVYDKEGISPTLNTMSGGHRQPFIAASRVVMKKNYMQYDLTGKGHNSQDQRAYYKNGAHGALPSHGASSKCKVLESEIPLTIRKLTPKECFRLMGFLNDEINLEGLSNTQQYKLAGNGWDINLASKIFKEMFKEVSR